MARKNSVVKRLDQLEERLSRMEQHIRSLSVAPPAEAAVDPWKHLVRRSHPWRKQLYLKGRNITARHLVGSMRANGFDQEKAAANYRVTVEAVREAVAYVEKNRRLLEEEARIERLMLEREGVARVL